MKQRILAVVIAMIGVAVLSLIGYTILSSVHVSDDHDLMPIDNAEQIYSDAVSKTDLATDHILKISLTREMTVDDSVFLEVIDQTVHYDMQSTGDLKILLQESLTTGTHTVSTAEIYVDGIVYQTVNGSFFVCPYSEFQYTEALIPPIILTPQFYKNLNGIDNGSSYSLNFSEALDTEAWLSSEPVTLHEARGVATVSYDGALESSMYTAQYNRNGIEFRMTVHVAIEQIDVDIDPPADTSMYVPISYLQGPKALERACGFLIQADSISSAYTDNIYFQAIGDQRTQKITLHAYKDTEWSMRMDTEVNLKNDTKQDQEIKHTKSELFLNNQYTLSSDNSEPSTNTGISVDTMYNYFQNQLVSTVMLPQYISSVVLEERETVLHISFTGTEAFGDFLAQNACQLLYNNPNLISDTGANLTSESLQCYLELDKFSGLPIASGIHYSGNYKAEGIPYQLQYSAEQVYIIPSTAAQSEIEKSAGK